MIKYFLWIYSEKNFSEKRDWIDCGAKAQNSAKMFSGIWCSWTEGWVIGTANWITRLLATSLVKMQSIKWNIACWKWIQSPSVFVSIIRFVSQLLFQEIMIAQANAATVLALKPTRSRSKWMWQLDWVPSTLLVCRTTRFGRVETASWQHWATVDLPCHQGKSWSI